jgi:hypothetical protein
MPAHDRVLAVGLIALSGWSVLALLRPKLSRSDVVLAAVLLVGCLVWLLQSPAYEGPTVLRLTATNGLTAADLGVPPGLFLAAGVLVRAARSGPAASPGPSWRGTSR